MGDRRIPCGLVMTILSALALEEASLQELSAGSSQSVSSRDLHQTQQLKVATSGEGSGSVTAPPGMVCPPGCLTEIPQGWTIVLTAQPSPDSSFAGWSGDCGGTDICRVKMDGPRNVQAKFARRQTGHSSQLPGPAPIIQSFSFVKRPAYDSRVFQPFQLPKPGTANTAKNAKPDASARSVLEIKGLNLSSVKVFSVRSTDILVEDIVPSSLPSCVVPSCIQVQVFTNPITKKGMKTLSVTNLEGQTASFQIEVLDGIPYQPANTSSSR
ncbi:hypothetical protein W02_04640 [Nitrospira sp. KM1]|nr:hypothetical protein W02_04640 [Nitrospira sp. KM1]